MTNPYQINDIEPLIGGNPYLGRGIVAGKSENGRYAAAAYFIMGRSENSRNRVFVMRDGVLYTQPFDPSRVSDPSLILYAALRQTGPHLIVTNGDQTDTINEGLQSNRTFEQALQSRCFEPDAPHLTPRISAMLTFENGDFSYEMSILKSIDEQGSACARYHFAYPSRAGLGHLIHTYGGDGSPLPAFCGEPARVRIPDDINRFADALWAALNKENRISLYVRYTDLASGQISERLINRNV